MLIFSPSTRRDLLASFAAAWVFLLTAMGHADDSAPSAGFDSAANAEMTSLIRKAIAARDRASKSMATARGRGRYNVTVIGKAMNVVYKERASFRLAQQKDHHFIQFRYQEGLGYDAPDAYARIVLTDGKKVYESLFCQRFRPTGAEATVYDENFEPGTLQPLVEVSGNLAAYYGFVERLGMEKGTKLSLRDEGGLKVVTGTSDGAASEFWIDPREDFHIKRYRLVLYPDATPLVVTDVIKQWKRQDGLWLVHRCLLRNKLRKGEEVVEQRKRKSSSTSSRL